jgi:hypothetical protein
VAYRADEESPLHAFRRDVWFSQEAPFGLVQFEDQVIDAGGGVVARQRWRMVAAGRFAPPPKAGAALDYPAEPRSRRDRAATKSKRHGQRREAESAEITSVRLCVLVSSALAGSARTAHALRSFAE